MNLKILSEQIFESLYILFPFCLVVINSGFRDEFNGPFSVNFIYQCYLFIFINYLLICFLSVAVLCFNILNKKIKNSFKDGFKNHLIEKGDRK